MHHGGKIANVFVVVFTLKDAAKKSCTNVAQKQNKNKIKIQALFSLLRPV